MINTRRINPRIAVAASVLLCAAEAHAWTFESGAVNGALDTQLTAGIGIRTNSPACSLIGDPTVCPTAATGTAALGDAGDLNYKAGQPFTAYTKATTELLLHNPDQGWNAMLRGSFLYDPGAESTQRTKLNGAAEDQIVHNFTLYDAWVSKDFSTGDVMGHVRLGNQAINWGESLFMPGGINATNAIDIQKSLIPGTQIKEFVLPSPMISAAAQLGGGWNVEGYYQFGWLPSRQPPPGSYWSVANGLGNGYRGIIPVSIYNFNLLSLTSASILRQQGYKGALSLGLLQAMDAQLLSQGSNSELAGAFLSDKNPQGKGMFDNQGQFGLSAHYKAPDSVVDFGFYYLRYHDKSAVLNQIGDTSVSLGADDQFSYRPARDLFGVSTNFPIGDWAIGGEISYRPRDAVALSGCYLVGGTPDANAIPGTPGSSLSLANGQTCALWKDMPKAEAHLTAILAMTASTHPYIVKTLGADQALLSIEVVGTDYIGLKKSFTRTVAGTQVVQLVDAGYNTWLNANSQPAAVGTAFSSGTTIDFNWTYDGTLIPGWQVTPDMTYFRAISGYTPTAQANYLAGAQSLNLAINFSQNPPTWQIGINYTAFFGGSSPFIQPYRDRNFVGLYITRNL